MKKTFLLIISALVFIIGTSVVIFNNAYQLANSLKNDSDLRLSFILLLIGVVIYSILNSKKIKNELR